MTLPYWIINFGVWVKGAPERLRLELASRNPKRSSARTLRRILKANKDTVYGREHHFGLILRAKDPDRLFRLYEKCVQADQYEAFRPYVDRHKKGEPDVLIKGKPLMYATTSGTTSQPKWIPISVPYMNKVYNAMSHVWLDNFRRNAPKFLSGGLMVSVGRVVEGYAEDGTIFGSVSGVTAKQLPSFIRERFVTPPCVYEIKDYTARYYTIMRLAIAHDVSYFVAPNPSTVLELVHNSEEYFDDYITDIENGTLSEKFAIADDIRKELEPMLKADPKRAAFLRSLKEKYEHPQIKHFWPNLAMISSWKCGNTALAAEKVQANLPDSTFYQELGYFSSECRFGLVLDHSINTVLFPNFHYYEFVEQSELESENPRFLRLHELQEGKRYCIYVTTMSGLYRYNMNDLVEAGPKFKGTPTIHMVQKVNGIVSITGEKLYEKQFVDAVHMAEAETGMKVNFFIGFANPEKSTYDFYYEFDDIVLRRKAVEFTEIVDRHLKEINIEYESKRDSLRLHMPTTYVLRRNAYDLFKKMNLEKGAKDGQFKLVLLLQDKVRQRMMSKLVRED